MRGRVTLYAALAGGLLLSAPALARAQVENNCDASRVMAMTGRDIEATGRLAPHHPKRVLDDVADLLGRDAYRDSMAEVIDNARAGLRAGGVSSTETAKYLQRLRELDSTFAIATTLPPSAQARHLASDVKASDFHLNQDALGNFPIFPGTPAQVVVSNATPVSQQRALCWPAITVDRLITLFGARHRAATVEVLRTLATRWENYVRNSYSQLPWELALNGALRGRSGYEPPTQQFILLHPSIGIEANGTVLKELRRVDVAVLEPVGWIFHYNDDYTRYLGVSGALTFASNRNIAVGGYAHLWFPQAKVGYVVRSDPERRRRGSFLVSVDLYDLLTDVPDHLEAAKQSALGRKLIDVTGVMRP
jgi:hypothetical protein